ncbi:TPA: hypothetical protein ACG1DY_005044 [Escherichia coli]
MAKTSVIKFNDFMDQSYKKKSVKKDIETIVKIVSASGIITTVILPRAVLAASMDGTFGNVHGAIMNAFDAGVVLVIIFAGASWGLGHRTKAIEILIGVSCGYILARHAVDIRDFLKGI